MPPILVLLIALFLLAPGSVAYTNARFGFRYTPPPGWTEDTSGANGELVKFQDPSSPALIAIAASATPGATLDSVVSLSKSDLSAQQQIPFQPAGEQAVTIGGQPGRELLYSASLMGIGIREKIAVVVNGDDAIVFFLTVPASGPSPAESLFDASLGSVTFDPASPAAAATLPASEKTGVSPSLSSGNTVSPALPLTPALPPTSPGSVPTPAGPAGTARADPGPGAVILILILGTGIARSRRG